MSQKPKVWRDVSKAYLVFNDGQQIMDYNGTTWQITVKGKWVSGEAIFYKGSDKPEWTQGVLAFLWGLVEKKKPKVERKKPTVSADGWTTVPSKPKVTKKAEDPYKGFAKRSDFKPLSLTVIGQINLLDMAKITEGKKKPFPEWRPTPPPRFPKGKPRALPRGKPYKVALLKPPSKTPSKTPSEVEAEQVETPVDHRALLREAVKNFDSLGEWFDKQSDWTPWVTEAYHFLDDLDKTLLEHIPNHFLDELTHEDYEKVREIPRILNAIDTEFQ